jgi:hypothetical protein
MAAGQDIQRSKTMTRILIATAAIIGFAGIASAQQAPFLYGNYSASVLDQYNGHAAQKIDFMGTAAIALPDGNGVQLASSFERQLKDNYSR